MTGPAAPKHAVAIASGRVPHSRRKTSTMAGNASKSSVLNARATTRAGRGFERSKTPSSVLVPPTSPASSNFVIDFEIILLHLQVRLAASSSDPSGHDRPAPLPLAGQLVVFTGKLSSLGRRDARALVTRLGGATADDVNARTTMLVIGAKGFPASGSDKSNKLKRAEDLNAAHSGHIQILDEDAFCVLAGVPTPDALKRQYHAMRDLLARYRALR